METLKPRSSEELSKAIEWAVGASQISFEVLGRGSKRSLGRPVSASHRLDLSEFSGVRFYEPEEMVLSVGASTPMRELNALLREKSQCFAFEPPDLGPLFGMSDNEATIGGVVACNLAGPRRLQFGAARDHILGFKGVNGRGEAFLSGGRVVKNVTGFDLSKLIAGSFGTFATLTDLTMRVLPCPKTCETLLLRGINWPEATSVMSVALQQTVSVTGAAYIPKNTAASSFLSQIQAEANGFVALRIESQGATATDSIDAVAASVRDFGIVDRLSRNEARDLWHDIRDARFFIGKSHQVWQINGTPSSGADIANEVLDQVGGLAYLDWGGGLIWLALEPSPDASQGVVRRATKRMGARATLIRASDETRRVVDVFDSIPPALIQLTERLRRSFDPKDILNPGRMRPITNRSEVADQ